MPFPRGSSQPGDWTHLSYVSALAGRFFTASATWEAPYPTLLEVKIYISKW